MTIVIDCMKLVKGNGKSTGIYNVAKNLTRALSAMEEFRNHIVVFGNRKNRSDFDVEGVAFREIRGPFENKVFCVLWELFLVPLAARRYRPDHVIFPRGFAPALHLNHDVVIVHDLIPFYYHRYFRGDLHRLENAYIMWRLRASIKKADTVITISEASRGEITRMVKNVGNKIQVIYNGCAPISVPEKRKDDGAYIAAVASPLPHKNARGIVRAYEVYRSLAKRPLPLKLLGVQSEWLERNVPGPVRQYITCYGYLKSDRKFYALIAGARFFLFLSLTEGFGLPPVEAMRLGVPVICSDRSSMPEIVGDAALLVNPDNPQEAGQVMKRLDEDAPLREEMRKRGCARSAFFSWERAAEAYGGILRCR